MNKVLMIAGTARSGSTLLDLMLGNSPVGFSAGEIHALFRPWRSHHLLRTKTCFCSKENCRLWMNVKANGERNAYRNLFNRLGVEFIVDSSKDLLWVADQIKYSKNEKYEIIPVVPFKSPVEYAYSLYKRNRMRGWKKQWIRYHLNLFKTVGKFISVQYKGLATNPKEKLKKLCESIGIDYFEGKEEYWQNDSNHLLFGSGTIKKSGKIVYYKEQYDESMLKEVRNLIGDNDKLSNQVLSVLEAFEIDKDESEQEKGAEIKKKIAKFPFINRCRFRLKSTSHYSINRLVYKLQKVIGR